MHIRTFTALGLALTLGMTTVKAAHLWEDPSTWWAGNFTYNPKAAVYRAQEISLDLFGSYIADERGIDDLFETNIRHGDWGGGVGLNYFFTRELGVGADINMSDNGGELVDMLNASLILRLPLGESGVAPYVFGGGGRGFDPDWEWLAHAGVGLEFRFNPTASLFTDARYIWADDSSDKLLLRTGIRLVF